MSFITINLNCDNAAVLAAIADLKGAIMATKDELQAQIDANNETTQAALDQLDKASAEITTEVQKLRDEISNGNVGTTPAMDASLERMAALGQRLKTTAQAFDDQNPDAPVDNPPPTDDGTQTP